MHSATSRAHCSAKDNEKQARCWIKRETSLNNALIRVPVEDLRTTCYKVLFQAGPKPGIGGWEFKNASDVLKCDSFARRLPFPELRANRKKVRDHGATGDPREMRNVDLRDHVLWCEIFLRGMDLSGLNGDCNFVEMVLRKWGHCEMKKCEGFFDVECGTVEF